MLIGSVGRPFWSVRAHIGSVGWPMTSGRVHIRSVGRPMRSGRAHIRSVGWTFEERPSAHSKRRMANGERPSAHLKRRMANGERSSAHGMRRTAIKERSSAYSTPRAAMEERSSAHWRGPMNGAVARCRRRPALARGRVAQRSCRRGAGSSCRPDILAREWTDVGGQRYFPDHDEIESVDGALDPEPDASVPRLQQYIGASGGGHTRRGERDRGRPGLGWPQRRIWVIRS